MAFAPKTPAIGPMAKPTGPTGILSSSREGVSSPGKRSLGGSKGLTGSPMKPAVPGARKFTGGGR